MAGAARKRRSTAQPAKPGAAGRSSLPPPAAGSCWSWRAELFAALLALAVSANSVANGFVYDDARGVVGNPDVDSATPWSSVWRNDFWGTPMSAARSHKSYRPLTVLTFKLNHAMTQSRDPAVFHATNVALHALVTLLFTRVARVVFGGAVAPAAMAGFLFAVHSIHTEAVANVVGRAELLCGVFFCLSFLAFASCTPRGPTSTSYSRLLLSLALSVAAMLSKEQGITVLGVSAVYEAVVRSSLEPVASLLALVGLASPPTTTINPGALAAFRRRVLALLGVGVVLAMGRVYVMHGQRPIFNARELPGAFSPDPLTRVLTLNYLVLFNAYLLVFPVDLCSDWAHGSIPVVSALSDPRAAATLAFYALLGYVTWSCLARMRQPVAAARPGGHPSRAEVSWQAQRREAATVITAVAFLALPFLPSSSLFFRVGFVVAERVLYLPSMGYCLLLAFSLHKLQLKVGRVRAYGLAAVIVLAMGARSILRNADWKSDFSIHEAGVATNPGNVKLVTNFGLEQHQRFKDEWRPEKERAEWARRAEASYRQALVVDPQYCAAGFDLGNLLFETGRAKEAIDMFKQALANADNSAIPVKTLNNLATVEYKMGLYADAEAHFARALQISPGHVTALNGLGGVYGVTKQFDKAEQQFRQVLALKPEYAEGHFNYGTLLYKMGRKAEAETALLEALRHKPNHAGAKNNLEVVRFDERHTAQASRGG